MAVYRLASTSIGKRLIGLVFSYMSALLPVKRLRETETLIAFHHPEPSYPFHVLMVPKRSIQSLTDLNEGDQQFLQDVFTCVSELVMEFSLEEPGYRLVLNGGEYQELPQLHFHLISE